LTEGSSLLHRQAGTLLEPVGDVWAAFSPASGETLLLNDEAAAILEVLAEGPCTFDGICRSLAEASATPVDEVAAALDASLAQLRGAGLIRTL
jgi:PqqD family protein of HPr-rel-A system